MKLPKQCKILDILLSENRVYSEDMANFGDYPGNFILLSGDREIRSKICSTLPDYPGESTAMLLECTALNSFTLPPLRKIDDSKRQISFIE